MSARPSALERLPWRHIDFLLVATVLAIAAFGCLMVYTATRVSLEAQGISPFYYLKKQAIFMVVGVVVMIAVAAVDYRHYRDWAPAIYGLCLLGLMGVLVVGHRSRGSQAWFQFGSLQLEPSEFAKIGLIVALAAYCASVRGHLGRRELAVILGLLAIPFALIYKQPDLGTALILVAVLVAMLVVAGISLRLLGVLALLGVLGMVGVVELGVLRTYQQQRLTSFLNAPNEPNPALLATLKGAAEYNQAESKTAIGDGGLLGKGIGKGPATNLSYVPEQYTDFIFSAVGEQVGFAGSVLLLILFGIVMWRTWQAARLSRDTSGTLMCVGVLAMLVFQVFENAGMAMGIMPIAGIPLPLMSYGGSSVIATFAAIGLVLNVRMRRFA